MRTAAVVGLGLFTLLGGALAVDAAVFVPKCPAIAWTLGGLWVLALVLSCLSNRGR